MKPHQLGAALGGRLDDLLPILRRDVPAITPLTNSDAALGNVGGHRFRVAFPHVVNGLKM